VPIALPRRRERERFGPGGTVATAQERRIVMVFLATILFVAACAGGAASLAVWAAGAAAYAGLGALWGRMAWRDVTVDVRLAPARVFAGEPVELIVRIANGKRLPLPVVRIALPLPEGLMPERGAAGASLRGFRRTVAVPGRSEVAVSFAVAAARRGEYHVGKISIELADPFDLSPIARELNPQADVLVMPDPRVRVPVDVLRRLPFGVPTRAPQIFEERERFAGVRPYEAGDPLNRIHWRLTGHAGVLQTKLFEPTRSADVLLALDLANGEPFWDSIYPDIAEDVIAWASFLARRALMAGWRVGLVGNTHLRRGRGPLRVPSSAAVGHEAALFAALARMPNEPTSDLAPVLREAARPLGRGTVVVALSARPGRGLLHELDALRRRGLTVETPSVPEATGRQVIGA
jgi:uncharacterized protein (DUF58 family)